MAQEASPFPLVLQAYLYILKFLNLYILKMLLWKAISHGTEVSRIYGSYSGCKVKYSQSRNTQFFNELMQVWKTRSPSKFLRYGSSKYLNPNLGGREGGISKTALMLLLWVKVLFWPKKTDLMQKNADIRKIKKAFVLKGVFSETTYGSVLTCQISSF